MIFRNGQAYRLMIPSASVYNAWGHLKQLIAGDGRAASAEAVDGVTVDGLAGLRAKHGLTIERLAHAAAAYQFPFRLVQLAYEGFRNCQFVGAIDVHRVLLIKFVEFQ